MESDHTYVADGLIVGNCTNTIDFDDMLHLVNRRSRNDLPWVTKMQQVFAHVLMDESQDTSVVSWEFINHLMGPDNRNLYVCGDISQSIFSFNGSSPQLIMDFANDWRGTPPNLYRLVRNHRSVTAIVNLANAIQEKMTTNTLPLLMESFRGSQGEQGKTRLLSRANGVPLQTPYDVSRCIAYEITSSRKPYKDFAILVRSSMQVREIEGELVKARIPYVVRGAKGLLQTEEVRDVLSYIRFATNPNDFSALSRAVGAPTRGIGDVMLEKVRAVARERFQGDLLKACLEGNPKLAGFANIIVNIQRYTTEPVKALDAAIRSSEYVSHIKKKYVKDQDKVEQKIENLERLKLMIEGLATETEMTTDDIVFQLTMDKTEKDDPNGSVTISTIHSSKGLEWPVVYVFTCAETCLPHWRSVGDDLEIDEERRLFYVAVTRGRDITVLCLPEKVQRGKYMSAVEPSRFLVELGIGC